MSKQFKLIGVGSPVVDSLAHVSEAFIDSIAGAKGGMELVDSHGLAQLLATISVGNETVSQAPGGSAGNTAMGVAELGLPVTFLGKLGNETAADFYRERFGLVGGDTSRFKVGDQANARCLSMVTPDSQRTMRTDLGAAATLAPSEVSAADFVDCGHAHIEGYLLFNPALMDQVLTSARQAGCTISLDLASFEVVKAAGEGLAKLLSEYVDVVFANEDEATAFFGEGSDYEQMARDLGKICRTAVVKMGADGAWICHEGICERVHAHRVETVVDTTGAGDLWAAGFLYGWLEGKSAAYSGKLGSLVGAEVVQIDGAAIPAARWDAIRAFAQSLEVEQVS
jgi:sugar/nucleoside kinase (ribokinase family)